MTSCLMKSPDMLNSSAIFGRAGVIIADEKGLMNVNIDTVNVTTHFRDCDQFRGFAESCGPSHVICSAHK